MSFLKKIRPVLFFLCLLWPTRFLGFNLWKEWNNGWMWLPFAGMGVMLVVGWVFFVVALCRGELGGQGNAQA
jgi:hypothetical protein